MRLIQLRHPEKGRCVARVEEPKLQVFSHRSIFDVANEAIARGAKISDVLREPIGELNYDDVYTGKSEWKILPAFDHPTEPSRCFVTGTGLTHKASAMNRQSMHGKP